MFHVRTPRAMWREWRQSGLADGPQWLIDAWGGTRTLSGETVNEASALAVADVFAAVNIIAGEAAKSVCRVYRNLSLTPGNSGQGIIETPEHRMSPVLGFKPNPYTPASSFWSTIAGHHLLWGNWFIEKLRDDSGLVSELRILQPGFVEVEFNEFTGAKRFMVTRMDGSRDGPFGPDRILHGFGFSKNGVYGLSPIEQAREAIGTVKARDRYQADAYTRPVVSGVVNHPGKLKSPVKLRESWRAVYGTGGPDRYGIAVLEEGAQFQPVTAPLADMQFVESAQLSKTQIAVLFKLPPGYLGGSTGDSLTYATVQQNRIQLADVTVAPLLGTIADFLSADVSLFPFPSWYAEFDLRKLRRGEPQAAAEYWATMQPLVNLDPEYIADQEGIPRSAVKEPEPVAPAVVLPSEEPATIADENA